MYHKTEVYHFIYLQVSAHVCYLQLSAHVCFETSSPGFTPTAQLA